MMSNIKIIFRCKYCQNPFYTANDIKAHKLKMHLVELKAEKVQRIAEQRYKSSMSSILTSSSENCTNQLQSQDSLPLNSIKDVVRLNLLEHRNSEIIHFGVTSEKLDHAAPISLPTGDVICEESDVSNHSHVKVSPHVEQPVSLQKLTVSETDVGGRVEVVSNKSDALTSVSEITTSSHDNWCWLEETVSKPLLRCSQCTKLYVGEQALKTHEEIVHQLKSKEQKEETIKVDETKVPESNGVGENKFKKAKEIIKDETKTVMVENGTFIELNHAELSKNCEKSPEPNLEHHYEPTKSDNKDRVYHCPHCTESFLIPIALKIHMTTTHNSLQPDVSKTLSVILHRIEQSSGIQPMTPRSTRQNEVENDDKQEVPKLKIGSSLTEQNSKEKVSESPESVEKQVLIRVSCVVCGDWFLGKAKLNEHQDLKHSELDIFNCEDENCRFSTTDLPDSSKHWRVHNIMETFHCLYCTASFRLLKELNLHVETLHSEFWSGAADLLRAQASACPPQRKSTLILPKEKPESSDLVQRSIKNISKRRSSAKPQTSIAKIPKVQKVERLVYNNVSKELSVIYHPI